MVGPQLGIPILWGPQHKRNSIYSIREATIEEANPLLLPLLLVLLTLLVLLIFLVLLLVLPLFLILYEDPKQRLRNVYSARRNMLLQLLLLLLWFALQKQMKGFEGASAARCCKLTQEQQNQ